MIEVKRALVSVYDKRGLVEFCARLHTRGIEIVSSGGTARELQNSGIPVTLVSDVTGHPEILGGRVKTLHPKIHAGILADFDQSGHAEDLAAQGIEPFQLVVSNLYPFSETVADPQVAFADAIEQIDIGGPSMVRASAKNHKWVGIVTSPDQYEEVAEAIEAGGLGDELRLRLAKEAFYHTAAYDASVVNWLERSDSTPERTVVAMERVQVTRYGENPHQAGARYRAGKTWWDGVVQHAGIEPSYLNVFDADAAWRLVYDLGDEPAVAIMKHANPCGAAIGATLAEAYRNAYECDSRSAFGGIVAFNRPVDADTVGVLENAAQADLVIAPGYDDGVIERIVARRKNTRILQAGPPEPLGFQLRQLGNTWLGQTPHRFSSQPKDWKIVTVKRPTPSEMADAAFAWKICGHTNSNAIVMAKDRVAWGIGAGQQNRVESAILAKSKAAGRAAGGACASDAFYPFPDGVEAAAEAGVSVVVQPGGAMRDAEVIARADELGLAMVFTGERHFLH